MPMVTVLLPILSAIVQLRVRSLHQLGVWIPIHGQLQRKSKQSEIHRRSLAYLVMPAVELNCG
jgi:hypothetical protein